MDDVEFEMLLNEIPHVTSLNLHHHQQQHNYRLRRHHHYGYVHVHGDHAHGMFEDDSSCHPKYMCVSPVSGLSLKSEGSSSSSHNGVLSFFDDGSPAPPKNTHHSTGLWSESKLPDFPIGRNSMGNLMGDPSLSANLQRMSIRDEQVYSPLPIGSYRLPSSDHCAAAKTAPGNVGKYVPFDDCRKSSYDYRELQCSFPENPRSFDEERGSRLLGLPQGYQMSNLAGSSNAPGFCKNCNNTCSWIPNGFPSISRPSITNALFYSQKTGMDSYADNGLLDSLSPHLTHPNLPLGLEYLQYHSLPKSNGRDGVNPNFCIPQYVSSTRNVCDIEAFNCEDSLIIQGEGLNYGRTKSSDLSREHEKHSCNVSGPSHQNSFHFEDSCGTKSYCALPLKYNSLFGVRGSIYFMAKDQHGCRFLQQKFDEGIPQDVQMIFNEIIDHVVELMMNPFGNYLMQKLLDVCDEEQRLQILLMVTSEPGELVKISLNTHGTRVVQKLIQTVKTQHQVSLIIPVLEPGFIDLINDVNGNHVLQRCLQNLSNENNKFIFVAATKFCVDIATHQYGCCVLQDCIAHAMGQHRQNLVAKISTNGLFLAQNAFGNYVVQYVLEMKIPSATTNFISQFEGKYVHLSMQKFSSNVVQKCLNVFSEKNRSRIIHELLSAYEFEQLLQDPFANYVIQTALYVSKGPLRASLVEAIRPHAAALRICPYSKKILSIALLRK